jgi:putative transposase
MSGTSRILMEGYTIMATILASDAPVTGTREVPDTQQFSGSDGAGPVGPNRAARRAAARAGASTVDSMFGVGALERAVAQLREGGGRLTGPDSFLSQMIKEVLEAGLDAELTEHLGYGRHDPAGHHSGNSRNGTTGKTVHTEVGSVRLDVPRDRAGTFTPVLLPKNETRLGGLSDIIISLYAGGMTVRDIGAHLQRVYGTELSHDTISTVTDAVLDKVRSWQTRPLDEVYPIIYVDALVVKVRDGAHVRNKAAHLVVGVDLDGVKHVLGIWVENTEGAKFWLSVCTELRNRGVRDVLIACCDGLAGLPEAIETVWPASVVQTCTVHLIRAAMRYVSYNDRKKFAAALKPIYTAPTADAAEAALLELADSPLGRKYKAAVAVWERAWDRFTPFLAFPPEIRKIIYTTNAIESFNYQIRKIIKNRGQFPTDDAVVKLIWLAITDIEDKRARAREKDRGKPANQRSAPGRLIEGHATQGWKQALNALSTVFQGRIPEHAI